MRRWYAVCTRFRPSHVQHLAPEGEPCGAGALIELLRGKVDVDDRLHAAARRVRLLQALPHAYRQRARQRTERRLEQAVLVLEVMCDQARRDVGTAGNLRQSCADPADFGETVDGDLDELHAPRLFPFVPGRAAAVVHEVLER